MISVCIATYNGEKYVKQQMESILPQLSEGDEVIISDDGSTDHTLQIIESFQDSRIQVFHHDSSLITTPFLLDRPTHNFENALLHAKGDIIFLSDQDDEWMPHKVKKMCQALEGADMAIHDCMVVNGTMEQVIEPSYFKYIHAHLGVWHNLCRCTYLGCCMAMRRCVVEKALPFPKTKVGHDLWLGIVADMQYHSVFVDDILLKYRKHENSKTTSGTKSRHSIWFKISYRWTVLLHILKEYIH